jgi:hypothetical protein
VARSELDASMAAYLQLPMYPAEQRLNGVVAKELDEYVKVIEVLLAHLAAGNVALAGELIDSELMPVSGRVEERQNRQPLHHGQLGGVQWVSSKHERQEPAAVSQNNRGGFCMLVAQCSSARQAWQRGPSGPAGLQ